MVPEDRVFCLVILFRAQAKAEAILEMIPPERKRELQSALSEMKNLDSNQMINEFRQLAATDLELASHAVKQLLGTDLENLPPILQRWSFRYGRQNY